MQNLDGTSHIAHAWLRGPAERTLIEPWLTEYAGLMTNAYPDAHPDEHPDRHPTETHCTLAVLTALDPRHPRAGAATALAA